MNRPEEALDCFLRTKMDVLALGSTIIGGIDGRNMDISIKTLRRKNAHR